MTAAKEYVVVAVVVDQVRKKHWSSRSGWGSSKFQRAAVNYVITADATLPKFYDITVSIPNWPLSYSGLCK